MNVSCQFIGRLGNNMFQIAACIGYAKKYGVNWGVPSHHKEVPRLHEFFKLPIYEGHEFRRYNRCDPSQFNYEPIPHHPNGTKLVGFFQSEKFFEGAHDEVRKVFNLPHTDIFKGHISLHWRRGDYATNPTNFPPITLDYVAEALYTINRKLSTPISKVVVFSDDIEYCKNVLPRGLSQFEFKFSHEENEREALGAMHSCEHNIIANSTFSWWGAWLNPNPDKIVVSPHFETWFGPENGVKIPPKDLIPPTWHQIRTR